MKWGCEFHLKTGFCKTKSCDLRISRGRLTRFFAASGNQAITVQEKGIKSLTPKEEKSLSLEIRI